MRTSATGVTPSLYQSRAANSGLEVNALAAIGRNQRLLALRPHDTRQWLLPGTPVTSGEPVEDGLRRALGEVLDASVASLTFLVAIEHVFSDRFGTAHHVLDLVFDTDLASRHVQCTDENLELRWLTTEQLNAADIAPPGLAKGLLSGRFDDGDRWLPWRRPASARP